MLFVLIFTAYLSDLLASIILQQINAASKISVILENISTSTVSLCHNLIVALLTRKFQQPFQQLQVTTSTREVLLTPYLYAPCSQGSLVSKIFSCVKVVNSLQDLIWQKVIPLPLLLLSIFNCAALWLCTV